MKATNTFNMRDFMKGMRCLALPICLCACSTSTPLPLPRAPASTQPMTHAPLPRIELRAFSMDGSREIAVTHDGLLTYKRFVQQQLEPLHTLQLTDAQIDELSAAAAAALQTRSRAEHFMDYRIFHTVGNEAFDDDGPNPRFNRINAVLWRLVRAYEPEPED